MTTLVEDDLRTRVSGDPAYAAEVAKLNSLKHELTDLEAVIAGANSKLADANRGTLNEAADRLIAGDSTDVDELIRGLNDSLETMRRRRRVLMVAVERQGKIVAEALNRVSIAICGELKPEHESLVRELTEALVKAAQASEREQEFRDRLRLGGVKFTATLAPMVFTHLRDPAAYSSTLAHWFRDAIRHGYASVDDVPTAWREGWGL